MSRATPIYRVQDKAWQALAAVPALSPAKLCGGTALSRFYLNHRVSFDLDFFVPPPFDPVLLGRQIKEAGLRVAVDGLTQDSVQANQWHGRLTVDGLPLKLSVIEDAYFDVYPGVERALGGVAVRTEPVEGLYHRKLLTITHAPDDGITPQGGRQTARDLFDLWVLSTRFRPLADFIKHLPYDYPHSAFVEGLAAMPWFELIDEFSQITASPGFEQGRDVGVVRSALLASAGVNFEAPEDGVAPAQVAGILTRRVKP